MRHRHHWGRGRRGWNAQRMGAWGWPGRLFGPGEVRLALLSLLSHGPQHGYQLMKELEARSGGMYRASAGTIYPTLQLLEDEGLVTSESLNGKRVYQLSQEGREELEAESATVRRIWRRADELSDWGCASVPEAWEITRPAMRVVKAAFRAASRGGDPDRIDHVRDLLERAAHSLDRLAAEE